MVGYDIRMANKAATPTEFQRFDRLVGQVLSVPKADVQRILADDKTKQRPAKESK
jgi:hypothetical protein